MLINKLKNISTKLGDKGTSRNYSNKAFKKSDILFDTLGKMDELSSFMGLAYHHTKYENIKKIQRDLQDINSLIATLPETEVYPKLRQINEKDILWIEKEMQSMLDRKPIEPRFYLPGSEKTPYGAYIDVCRTLTRRAERRLNQFVEVHERTDLAFVKSYINRLSDFMFVLSFNV